MSLAAGDGPLQPVSVPQIQSSSLKFLLQGAWWARAFKNAYRFAPHCLWYGIGLAVLNVVVVLVNYGVETAMKSAGTNVSNIEGLLVILALFVGVLLVIVAVLGITFWVLWLWLLRLTAFSHAWLTSDGSLDNVELIQQSLQSVGERKQHLWLVWLFASFYVVLPAIALALVIAINMLTGPQFTYAGQPLVPLPAWATSPGVHQAVLLSAVGLSIICLAYMLVVTAASSVSTDTPFRTATAALRLCCTHAVPIMVITIVVTALNVLIGAPYLVLLFSSSASSLNHNIWFLTVTQAWQGVSSIILWPVSLAPMCQLLSLSDTKRTE